MKFSGFYRKRIEVLWKLLVIWKNQGKPDFPLVAMKKMDYNDRNQQKENRAVGRLALKPPKTLPHIGGGLRASRPTIV